MKSNYRQCRSLSSQPIADDILSQYSNVELEGNNIGYAMEMLAKADAVCFDVDSTVIDEEGIVSIISAVHCGVKVLQTCIHF
jgi:hypothetical protein